LETMVNRQIDAILKGEILYTKDVFVPKETLQEINTFDNAHELKAASALAAKLKETDYFSSVMEEIKEDNHVCVIATLHDNEEFVNLTIHIDSMEISCDKNGIDISIDEVSAELGTFSESYEYICRVVDDLSFVR
ncbi:MAG: hypothetical protein K2M91_04670, partial [Lachnospiraceae bacterium]|nr:hypothetical protein [Lachnospiraceae bacterium]